ncbi:MAG: DUF4396 domain-containing protein [Actinobacteria bacterium]|nr:DUF4396 domain-containing protein [Actinomycetota bacterium]
MRVYVTGQAASSAGTSPAPCASGARGPRQLGRPARCHARPCASPRRPLQPRRRSSPRLRLSITTIEIVDNAFILIVPSAIDAGLSDALFWWSLGLSLVIAFIAEFPGQPLADRPRGRGHAVVHELHAH